MRLGGPVFERHEDPAGWVLALRRLGYRAAYCPLESGASSDVVQAYERAAAEADIVIAEAGAWSNPLSPDEPVRRAALEKCRAQLALADEIGARCCVNIAGAQGPQWDGPYASNLTPATFDLIVETVRSIIDAVRPLRTFYTLEPMPWMYPDSPESYLQLIRAIDRPRFAVHLDPVNWISSPQRYFANGALMRAWVDALGPYIKSVHAKDIALGGKLTVHLDEVRAGLGGLDYAALLGALSRLDPDMPLMLEHLQTAEDYGLAAAHVRAVAREAGVELQCSASGSLD